MQNHNILPFEYGKTENVDITQPPKAMLQEIGQILKKHQALNRFGLVQMDHTTQLPQGYIMNESCDILNRQLYSVPTQNNVSPQVNIETQWSLNHPHLVKQCKVGCEPGPEAHGGGHKPTTEIEPS